MFSGYKPAEDEESRSCPDVWQMLQHRQSGYCSPNCQAQLGTGPENNNKNVTNDNNNIVII